MKTAWRIERSEHRYRDSASGRFKVEYTHKLVGGTGKVRDVCHWPYPVPPDSMIAFIEKCEANC